ncbi:MAG: cadmium-translocating P-type ATPase [Acidobacteriia bacterium]|nr:cadmium-translocating P-type ATPase [Terriglobia bacterium]
MPARLSESVIAIIAAGGIAVYLALRPFYATDLPLFIPLVVGGIPLLYNLVRRALKREFGTDLLAGVSILTAVLTHEYLVGAIIVLMLSGGAALEAAALHRASAVLDALAKRMPSVAHRQTAAGITDVPLRDIAIGDRLVVLPHELCPADGNVIEGQGVMDESYLTGEPFMIAKTVGSGVFSGAINGTSALTIEAAKLAVDSRYAGIMRVVEETANARPGLRRIGDRLGAWYTPFALAIAGAAWIVSHDPTRFLAVLVIATPCPLLIAIPVAVIGAVAVAARRSIIVKNPAALEVAGRCRTLIFDKTGTLTYGSPAVTDVVCAPGFTRADVLVQAASLEQYSKHPLAGAVLKAAREEGLALSDAASVHEKPGQGLGGVVRGRNIEILGRKQNRGWDLPEAGSGLECIVAIDGAYAATFRFHDAPRSDSGAFVRHLRPKHAIDRVMLVSGDRESEVRYLADQVGIAEIHAGMSPEEKVAIVRRETTLARTLFVGDGINDAPALLAATVGVAFGQNSDVTAEAADAVVLEPSLAKVDEFIHIAQRMRRVALQSAVGGMVLSLGGMILAAAGHLLPIEGAIAQEVIDLVAVVNAVRTAIPSRRLRDF